MKRLFLAAMLLPACNWINQADIDERLPTLDDDQDGFTRDGGGDPRMADCDDTNKDIYPGAEDAWYDGVDADCAKNDDYDQDNDGHRSDSETDDDGNLGDDCDDLEATSFPGATDEWYDGVDADCAENDDYDQDDDGYRSDSETDDDGNLGDDCDDTLLEVHPGAVEDLSDFTIDYDCDGAGDSVLMRWESSLSWAGIGSIHMGQTTDRVYLSSVSDSFTDTTGTTYHDLGVATYWDKTSLDPEPAGVEFWTSFNPEASVDRSIASGHSMLFEEGFLYGAMALINSASASQVRNERLYRLDLTAQSLATAAASSPGTSDLSDITLFRDSSDSLRFIGCDSTGNGAFKYLLTDDAYLDDPNTSSLTQNTITTLGRPRHCVAQDRGDTEPYLFYQNNSSSDALEQSLLDSSTFDSASLSISLQNQFQSVEVNDLDYLVANGMDWLVLTDGLNSELQLYTPLFTLFSQSTGTTPDAIDIAWDAANSRVLIAWTDLSGGGHIGWGDSSGFLGTATLNSSLSAKDIAIIVPDNSDDILVVLTDGDDLEMARITAP